MGVFRSKKPEPRSILGVKSIEARVFGALRALTRLRSGFLRVFFLKIDRGSGFLGAKCSFGALGAQKPRASIDFGSLRTPFRSKIDRGSGFWGFLPLFEGVLGLFFECRRLVRPSGAGNSPVFWGFCDILSRWRAFLKFNYFKRVDFRGF